MRQSRYAWRRWLKQLETIEHTNTVKPGPTLVLSQPLGSWLLSEISISQERSRIRGVGWFGAEASLHGRPVKIRRHRQNGETGVICSCKHGSEVWWGIDT